MITEKKEELKLTQKHEDFAQCLFKGMYQRDAYTQVYGSDSSIAIIDTNSSRLARSEQVMARLASLRGQVEAVNVLSIAGRKERLTVIAEEDIQGKHGPNRQPNISAIAELNKMEHVYEPATINYNAINITVEREQPRKLIEDHDYDEKTKDVITQEPGMTDRQIDEKAP